jgi:phospholipid-binding lipoprotein MlaA
MLRMSLVTVLSLAAVLLSGCASRTTTAIKPNDPFEKLNRRMYAFNVAFDRALSKPVTRTYRAVTPRFIKTGIANFVSNLGYPAVFVNDALQGKGRPALRDTGRFLVNSTIGLAGFLDPATSLGLEENKEDLSQTLGRWGVGPGPYLVLPFAGPTTLRDGIAKIIDPGTSPLAYVDSSAVSTSVKVLRLLNSGSGDGDDDDGESLEEAAFDPYLVTRSIYLQRRNHLVHDGDVPEDPADRIYDYYATEEFIDAQSFRQASIELSGEPPFEFFPDEAAADLPIYSYGPFE